ncbi:abortive infection system antitoxin AbiGi family protein [Rugamonas rubra]|uniref:Putative abortive phage resistance protein AbiGi, antitoxin n=1 Tax=Rugamonas rubra TaxID=758825 RepID=A0A1I4UA30_9BURK|nr:abortive infection system antitoxin AbiGi family protein [Rugamonas rubra]SFM85814.1 Putative abortive phage resistance protein AbiGi, antitoxin [Rugamonas rubra]
MQSPYPDILFHFTKLAGLKAILNDQGFRPGYSTETINNNGADRKFAAPMVSFCDLRLSELPTHMRKYGKFGIGMTKEWALINGLNPVAYVNKNSEFTNNLLHGLQGIHSLLTAATGLTDYATANQLNKDYMNLMNVQRYIKNYEGILERKNKKAKHYRFADEREWRYVLPLNSVAVWPFVPESDINDPTKKQTHKDLLEPYRLTYNVSDVKYIIVAAERNVKPMREHIESLVNLSAPDKEHLLARILTAAQIEADM